MVLLLLLLHQCPGQLVPVFNNPFREEIVPWIQPQHPLAQPAAVSSAPGACSWFQSLFLVQQVHAPYFGLFYFSLHHFIHSFFFFQASKEVAQQALTWSWSWYIIVWIKAASPLRSQKANCWPLTFLCHDHRMTCFIKQMFYNQKQSDFSLQMRDDSVL